MKNHIYLIMLLCSQSVVLFACDSCTIQTLQPCRLARGLGPPVVRRERDENTQEEQEVHVHVVGVVSVTGHTTRKLIFKVCSRGLSATCRCSASAVFLLPWACIHRISYPCASRGCGVPANLTRVAQCLCSPSRRLAADPASTSPGSHVLPDTLENYATYPICPDVSASTPLRIHRRL